MIKKTITYTDFNGDQHTEDFYFNLNKAEMMEFEMSMDGGLTNYIEDIQKDIEGGPEHLMKTQGKKIVEIYKSLILKSYGVKSEDGKSFIKTEEARQAFEGSNAFSEVFMELATVDGAATKFIVGVIPPDNTNKNAQASNISSLT